MSIGSGTATVKIQTSTNRTAWTDLITFTNVTAAGSEYKRTVSHTATVSRYLRCYVTNTFTSLVAAVAVMPYRSLQS
jgi:formate/nitrite transporter FocA (FNT family)